MATLEVSASSEEVIACCSLLKRAASMYNSHKVHEAMEAVHNIKFTIERMVESVAVGAYDSATCLAVLDAIASSDAIVKTFGFKQLPDYPMMWENLVLEATGSGQPEVAARACMLLGECQAQQGDYVSAMDNLAKALRFAKLAAGKEQKDPALVAAVLVKTGHAHLEAEEYASARGTFAAAEKMFPDAPGCPQALDAKEGSARSLWLTNDCTAAELSYLEVLAGRKQAQGGRHPDVAATLHSLALVADAQQQWGKAKGYYQQALGIREAVLGLDHPDTIDTNVRLMSALEQLGLHERAERLKEQSTHKLEAQRSTEEKQLRQQMAEAAAGRHHHHNHRGGRHGKVAVAVAVGATAVAAAVVGGVLAGVLARRKRR